MAYVVDPDDLLAGGGGGAQDAQAMTPQGAATMGNAGGGGGGGTVGSGPKAPKQGRFADIQRLLFANEGQGARAADQAIGRVESAANRATGALNQAQSAYRQQAQSQVPNYTAPALDARGFPQVNVNTPISVQTPYTPGPRGTPGTFTMPTTWGPTPTAPVRPPPPDYGNNIHTMQGVADAQYRGPNSLNETSGVDMSRIQRLFADAGSAANALGSAPGLSTLLGRSGGAGAFDSMLAQREGRPKLQEARKRFAGLRGMLDSAIKDTSVSDTARSDVAREAQEAQNYLNAGQAQRDAQDETNQRMDNNARENTALHDSYDQFIHSPGWIGTPGMTFEDWLAMPPEARDQAVALGSGVNNFLGSGPYYDWVRNHPKG